jgi:hypothetical protein
MQSKLLQAGTIPVDESIPMVGFTPIKLLKPAGTRPEPAVSLPKLKVLKPRATAVAEPALEPPEI